MKSKKLGTTQPNSGVFVSAYDHWRTELIEGESSIDVFGDIRMYLPGLLKHSLLGFNINISVILFREGIKKLEPEYFAFHIFDIGAKFS